MDCVDVLFYIQSINIGVLKEMERALEENTTLQELTVIIIGGRSAQLHHLLESVFASGTLETLCLKDVSGEYV